VVVVGEITGSRQLRLEAIRGGVVDGVDAGLRGAVAVGEDSASGCDGVLHTARDTATARPRRFIRP
jgi:hypothetical protein